MATSLSMRNMNHSPRYQSELNGGATLNAVDRLGVRLQVARSLQKQTGWGEIIQNGEEMEQNVFFDLMRICNSDPKHDSVVPDWFSEMQAREQDYADLKRTEADARI